MLNIQRIGLCTVTAVILGLTGCTATPENVAVPTAPLTTAPIQLKQEMQHMGQASRQLGAAQTVPEALSALEQFTVSIERASLVYPEKIATNEAEKTAYLQDLARMQTVITEAKQLVEKNDLATAKQHAQQLNSIKDEAHKRYR